MKAFGWLTAAFGAFACVMVLASWNQQTAMEVGARFGASAAVALVGAAIAWRAGRVAARIDPKEAERHILKVALAHNGRITATEVAAETPVPLAQAGELLEALSNRGACRMSVAEVGIVVFEFPELEQRADESSSDESAQKRAAQARAAQRSST